MFSLYIVLGLTNLYFTLTDIVPEGFLTIPYVIRLSCHRWFGSSLFI